ncbi:fibronectin type III domain-containing protein [Pedosphaera parvula]|uniref:Fibronectin type III domain protein n=1 Tax=Pedosphaera parvula (strain Ellin514) TaxID=320771 RepID=B9XL62_PEDPL|nr:fibronectin type III domain-containing protein [Pedosphaera parvula]EEF59413.1 Fibronectin type III domain protein [Pedosphaera parvula Ellin514]
MIYRKVPRSEAGWHIRLNAFVKTFKTKLSVIVLLCWALGLRTALAVDATWEYSVRVSAYVQSSPPQITLTWPQDTLGIPNSYTIYRKSLDATDWGSGTTLSGNSTSYTDYNVNDGGTYEYQIVKQASAYTSYGYNYAGIDAPLIESRGTLLLVVDNTYASDLANELSLLQQDLVGDGWSVVRQDVGRGDSVQSVKSWIQGQYNGDPQNVKAVFLFGHVPVPYSGDISPDGHPPDHQGAWPADVYYGDMDGNWTDYWVYDVNASDSRNHNVPYDGKFDQSTIPGTVRLMVGRVDLANMPGQNTWNSPPSFPSELDLLRNYLNKDHNFRFKQIDVPRRGVVGDYFGFYDGEAFAASGWRNFAPFFGANNIDSLPNEGSWIRWLNSNPYLWAYACGPGEWSSINGIGNQGNYYTGTTTDIVGNNVQAVFTLIFGSWLGDWDVQDDLMRSILATPTYGLACGWSGRPHWFCHHMALGQPIGYSTRLTQNNGQYGLYQNDLNEYAGYVHIALMGDPALRMHVVAPPSNLYLSANPGGVYVSWNGSGDSVIGYNIYRSADANGPFIRVNNSPVTNTSYTDATVPSGTFTYMVRAVKLELSGSGTYYNASQGIFSTVTVGTGPPPPPPGNPTVTIMATTPTASRLNSSHGTFTITRVGDTSTDLAVHYFFAGTAAQSDFQVSPNNTPGIIVIPAGQASATLDVIPVGAGQSGSETVTVAITDDFPSPGYTIGWPENDTVTITGSTNVTGISIQVNANGVKLTWPSQSGGSYHVLYKTRLSDNWNDFGTTITAAGSSASWVDTSGGKDSQRFYSIFKTN